MTMIDSTVAPAPHPLPAGANDEAPATPLAAAADKVMDAVADAVAAGADWVETYRRMQQIENLGRQIKSKVRDLGKKETAVAEADAARKSAMEDRNMVQRQLDELHDELATLASGGKSERLFPPQDDKPALTATLDAEAEAWKSVPIESLGGLSVRVLKALRDREPPIVTIGDLSAWQQAKGDYWAKDIKGLGKQGREELEDALQEYWTAHPREPEAAPVQPASA